MFWYMKNLNHTTWMHPGLLEVTAEIANSLEKEKVDLAKVDVDEMIGDCTQNQERRLQWHKMIRMKALMELDGSFDRRYGYILTVNRIPLDSITGGIIQPQTGFIEYSLKFDATVQFPCEGEVIDAVVFKVFPSRVIFCFSGFIYGVVSFENFCSADDFEYKEIVEIGEDDVAKLVPAFVSFPKKNKFIKVGCVVRLKIVSRTFGNTGFWLIGSMKSQHLGLRVDTSPSAPLSPSSSSTPSCSSASIMPCVPSEITEFSFVKEEKSAPSAPSSPSHSPALIMPRVLSKITDFGSIKEEKSAPSAPSSPSYSPAPIMPRVLSEITDFTFVKEEKL